MRCYVFTSKAELARTQTVNNVDDKSVCGSAQSEGTSGDEERDDVEEEAEMRGDI